MGCESRRIRVIAKGMTLSFLFLFVRGPVLRGEATRAVQQIVPLLTGADPSLSDRSVRKTDVPDGYQLSYDWRDLRGVSHRIGLSIPRSELIESEKAFGFSIEELWEFLRSSEARIREEKGLSALDIARMVVAENSDPEWCQVSQDPTNVFNFIMRTDATGHPDNDAEIERIIRASRKAWEASQKAVSARLEEEMRDYMKARGMVVTPQGIAVRYRGLVRANKTRLAPLAAEFRRICGPNKKKLLEIVLSFVQSIPFRPRSPVENAKYTAGLAVPLRVLAEDTGDCDSKAVLFASIWTNLCRHRTILIKVPEHMLVGVAVPLIAGSTLELDSARYVLLEVSCGARLLPGEITQYSSDFLGSGQLKYQIVS